MKNQNLLKSPPQTKCAKLLRQIQTKKGNTMPTALRLIPLIALYALLSACATPNYINMENNGRAVNAAYVKLNDDTKITAHHIHLTYSIAEGQDIGELRWTDIQQQVKQRLEDKGIRLDEQGLPVHVRLNYYKQHGSYYYPFQRRSTALSGAASGIPGLNILALVGANLIERAASEYASAQDKAEGKDGDGRNFVPEVNFTLTSPTTESTVNLIQNSAISNYLMVATQLTRDGIIGFFEPAEKTPQNNVRAP